MGTRNNISASLAPAPAPAHIEGILGNDSGSGGGTNNSFGGGGGSSRGGGGGGDGGGTGVRACNGNDKPQRATKGTPAAPTPAYAATTPAALARCLRNPSTKALEAALSGTGSCPVKLSAKDCEQQKYPASAGSGSSACVGAGAASDSNIPLSVSASANASASASTSANASTKGAATRAEHPLGHFSQGGQSLTDKAKSAVERKQSLTDKARAKTKEFAKSAVEKLDWSTEDNQKAASILWTKGGYTTYQTNDAKALGGWLKGALTITRKDSIDLIVKFMKKHTQESALGEFS